tara:strand:- start:17425 stop:18477 length:1053 start_codon:yes stop_codon:yes gene_type:complete
MNALSTPVPTTLGGALNSGWLSEILVSLEEGPVADVEVVDPVQVNQTIKATIVRFRARFENGQSVSLCLKGFLDRPEEASAKNHASVRESRFYTDLSGRLNVRVPEYVTAPLNPESGHGIVYMRDMVEQNAHFCSALEPFDADRTARSLEQLALLHTSHLAIGPVEALDWTFRQIDWLAGYMTPEVLQNQFADSRRDGIPAEQRDAGRLIEALKALSVADAKRPAVLVHGDCHAGNVFETAQGAGLIDFQLLQQGGWALDVAYHIAATLPVEVAEHEERRLLRHYLDFARGAGAEVPDDEEAWTQYRMSAVYGYFLWAITRTVEQKITNTFCHRLSNSVARHESFRLLGV